MINFKNMCHRVCEINMQFKACIESILKSLEIIADLLLNSVKIAKRI